MMSVQNDQTLDGMRDPFGPVDPRWGLDSDHPEFRALLAEQAVLLRKQIAEHGDLTLMPDMIEATGCRTASELLDWLDQQDAATDAFGGTWQQKDER